MYIVSARKYRPDSFDSLVGQDTIVQTLKNSIIRKKLAHAYLFCGPRGVGKTSAARIFAKAINCSSPTGDMEPCGHCESCLSFQEGRSYCIHELDAASNNSVDDIKALIDQVNIPPQVGRYSVFIVDEVHMLSQQAFNAFLKTLEEPPAHAIFILATTEKHKILPTILSRCQTYDFNRISIPDMVANLRKIADSEGVKVEDESLHVIAMKADGAMRDALTIFDQTVAFCGTEIKYDEVLKNLNVLSHEHSFALVEAFLKGDYQSALLKFDEILSKGFNALHFVSALSSHLRNLMVAKSQALDALLELPASLKARYKEQAQKCTLQFLYDALTVTSACETGYKASVNQRLHIEFALMKLCFLSDESEVSVKTAVKAAPKARIAADAPTESTATSQTLSSKTLPVEKIPEPVQKTSISAVPEKGSEKVSVQVPEQGQTIASSAEAAPSRRRVAPRVMLSSQLTKTEENKGEMPDSTTLEDRIPDDETINSAWAKLATQYPKSPRLTEALSSAKLEIELKEDYKLVTFRVTNAAQKDWIESKLLRDIDKRLCGLAGSGKLRVAVDVKPLEEIEKKSYLPAEKAAELIASNPEIKALVKDLDLDT